MSKTAPTDHPVHELIAKRWSPCGFSDQLIDRSELASLLEAARWAASSYNEQPWSFLVATRDQKAEFDKVLACLVEANQQWAKNAAALIITVASLQFARNGKPNHHALHDVGLAVGNLSLEATARGMVLHQMAGILPEKAREVFNIPEQYQPVTGVAVGYLAAADTLPDNLRERDQSPRSRKPISEFTFTGTWGQTSPLVAT